MFTIWKSMNIPEFEKVVGDRGAGWWQVYAPLAQLGLARAYAMRGDREKSRKAYDDFFVTRKDADPDIPMLRQAKAEYRKLSVTTSVVASRSKKSNSPAFLTSSPMMESPEL